MKYVLAIDQSTQGSKVALYDEKGALLKKANRNHTQKINDLGYVSHDVEEIYTNLKELVKEVVESIEHNDIVSIGISNQRETTVIFDEFAHPLNDAIVWQCNRSKDIVERYQYFAEKIKEKTGLVFSPYFPLSKAKWLLEHSEIEAKKIHLGTIDSYLIYRLTNHFYTDVSNASRTEMFNIKTLDWDDEILSELGIKKEYLPKVMDSDADFGTTDFDGILTKKVPIYAVLGDSHAALFGHHCLHYGDSKITYGTGSSIMINTEEKLIQNPILATSIGYKVNNKLCYVLEGNINYTGAIISWLKNDVHLIQNESEIEELIEKANPKDQTILIPAFSGLGAPYYFNDMKASLLNMDRNTGKNEIVKASVNAIALQINDILDEVKKSLNLQSVKADGGASENNYLMQCQSDLSDCDIEAFNGKDMSLKGVAILAGLKAKLYDESVFNGNNYRSYRTKKNDDANALKMLYHHYIHLLSEK